MGTLPHTTQDKEKSMTPLVEPTVDIDRKERSLLGTKVDQNDKFVPMSSNVFQSRFPKKLEMDI